MRFDPVVTHTMVNAETEIDVATVVFRHDQHDRQTLAIFAREFADSGCRIGGMVQEVFFDDQGRRTHIDSVDLATGDRVTINQPSRTRPDGTGCTLDTAALADAGAPLRRALTDRPDLVIVEKYSEQEQSGAGLLDEILRLFAAGLPTLVLVPEPALASWRELTGGEAVELQCEAEALRHWWRDRSTGVEPITE